MTPEEITVFVETISYGLNQEDIERLERMADEGFDWVEQGSGHVVISFPEDLPGDDND